MSEISSKISTTVAELSRVRKTLASAYVLLSHAQEDLEGRQTFLTPLNGWLAGEAKATEKMRAVAAEQVFQLDPICVAIRKDARTHEDAIALLEVEVKNLESEFQAQRWQVRDRLNDILDQKPMTVEEPAGEARGFDEAADDA